MKKKIRTIGLFGKFRDPSVRTPLEKIATFLRQRGLDVCVDDHTAKVMPEGFAPVTLFDEIGKHIDLGVVVGGDGTMLNVARHLAPFGVPVIGINQGRLGFLTDIPADRMIEEVGRILDGDYHTEKRLLLSAELMRKGKIIHTATAFNDVTVTKGELARMIEFETFIDGEFVSTTRGDGIIISSPTGSTAYAMSAGGPLLHPVLPAIVMVPICPHTLSYRPLVVSSDCVIEIVMIGAADALAHVSFDGQATVALAHGDRLYVRRADWLVELVQPSKHSHYEVLRVKLGWGEQIY